MDILCTVELTTTHGYWNTSNKPFPNNRQEESEGWLTSQYLASFLLALFPNFIGLRICATSCSKAVLSFLPIVSEMLNLLIFWPSFAFSVSQSVKREQVQSVISLQKTHTTDVAFKQYLSMHQVHAFTALSTECKMFTDFRGNLKPRHVSGIFPMHLMKHGPCPRLIVLSGIFEGFALLEVYCMCDLL